MRTLALCGAVALSAVASAQTPTAKVDIVAVTGCLKEQAPNTWMLVSATDPVPSNANAPPAKELPLLTKTGKNEFRLLGVEVFNLPAHKDRTVVVKGLHLKAMPTSRLNVTSVTTVAETCPPPAPK